VTDNTPKILTDDQSNAICHDVLLTKRWDSSSSLKQKTIKDNFLNLSISEDIGSPFVTAVLYFIDTEKIYENTPFLGEDLVTIVIKSQLRNVLLNFKFIVTNYEIITENMESPSYKIRLDLISDNYIEAITPRSVSFSKAGNKSISTFVKEYAKKNFNYNVLIEETEYDKTLQNSFAFPFISFIDMLTYLKDYAKSKDGYTDYLYYSSLYMMEEKKRIAWYTSLSFMLKQSPVSTYQQTTRESAKFHANDFYTYNFITPNMKSMIDRGGLGSNNFYFDYSSKSIVEETASYKDAIDKNVLLGNYSLMEDYIKPSIKHEFISQKNYSNQNMILDNTVRSAFGFVTKTVGILERSVGTVNTVNFFPSKLHIQTGNNTAASGNYLLKSIIHNFTRTSFEQVLTFVRNGWMLQSSGKQVKAKKSNIVKVGK
jgi:hypothetical protein